MEKSHELEDVNHQQSPEFKSKFTGIILILLLIGLITSFMSVVKGPYQSILKDNLWYKGWEVGLFPPLFLLISCGLFSSNKPLKGLFVHLFFLVTFFAELFYNNGGLILRSSNEIILIPFLLYVISVLGIFVFLVLGTIEYNSWTNRL